MPSYPSLPQVILDEESGQLGKRAWRHPLGEVWHLDCSPTEPRIVACTYGERAGPGGWRKGAAVLGLPEGGGGEGEGEEVGEVEVLAPLAPVLRGGEPSSVTFQPNDSSKIVCLAGDRVSLADLGSGGGVQEVWSTVMYTVQSMLPKVSEFRI